jgi:hypothetical protein
MLMGDATRGIGHGPYAGAGMIGGLPDPAVSAGRRIDVTNPTLINKGDQQTEGIGICIRPAAGR